MKKRLVGMIMAVMLGVSMMAGCETKEAAGTDAKVHKSSESKGETANSKEEKDAKDLHIVYVTPLLASDVWLVSKEGFDDAASEMGFAGDWVGPANIDVDSMIKQMEIAIAEGADGIITCGLNPEAMVNVMNQAKDADIPVVLVNAGSEMEAPYFSYIGTNGNTLGSMAAMEVEKKMGKEAPHVIYVGSTITNSSVIDTTNGYHSVFEKIEGYKKLSLEENKDDVATSVDLWQNLFTAYPDVNVCANVSPAGAVGAAQVADELGILDKVTIMSIDDTDEILDLIKENKVYGTMSQNYYRMGYQAAKWIVDYKTKGAEPENKINDSGTVFVNKDNVDTFRDTLRDKNTWK